MQIFLGVGLCVRVYVTYVQAFVCVFCAPYVTLRQMLGSTGLGQAGPPRNGETASITKSVRLTMACITIYLKRFLR